MLISYALLRPLTLTHFSLASHVANLLNSLWKAAYLSRVWISCLDFLSTKRLRSADDMKGFLALGYSLKRASLNTAQSGGVASNSMRFSQSSLYSLSK